MAVIRYNTYTIQITAKQNQNCKIKTKPMPTENMEWDNFLFCESVVWTSVFGWRTFPDLCVIYGWHVIISWVKCPLWVSQPAFHPSGVGKWVVIRVITWIRGWRPLNGRPGLCMAVWSHVKVRGCRLSLRLIACTPFLWCKSAAAAAVCGLWRYTSVICLCVLCLNSRAQLCLSVCLSVCLCICTSLSCCCSTWLMCSCILWADKWW